MEKQVNPSVSETLQRVKWNFKAAVISDVLKVTCGEPQGSVLDTKLFILSINDICIMSNLLFADDTIVFCSSKNLEQLHNRVENE